jgi:hypothetical protein
MMSIAFTRSFGAKSPNSKYCSLMAQRPHLINATLNLDTFIPIKTRKSWKNPTEPLRNNCTAGTAALTISAMLTDERNFFTI